MELLPPRGRSGFQNPFAASEAAYRILMELCAAAPRADACSELVQGAIDLIRSEPAFLAGVDELAEKLGVSKSHLIRTFTAEVGESPGKFLQRERIDAAKLLLLNREYPVETVANMTGYAGANYFCKVFRRLTGESPGEYRARASAPLPGRDLPGSTPLRRALRLAPEELLAQTGLPAPPEPPPVWECVRRLPFGAFGRLWLGPVAPPTTATALPNEKGPAFHPERRAFTMRRPPDSGVSAKRPRILVQAVR
ncbi:MAG: helix-turn-helix transcriptional regulator [Anaerotruncus massiliensis (ex Togo et al. 2019)]